MPADTITSDAGAAFTVPAVNVIHRAAHTVHYASGPSITVPTVAVPANKLTSADEPSAIVSFTTVHSVTKNLIVEVSACEEEQLRKLQLQKY